jgi:putative selenium metabolism hydrolase
MNNQKMIKFTQDIVRIPSISGEEEKVINRIKEEMHSLNFDKVWKDANGTAIGLIEGKEPGPTILLDAHCDTVSIAPGVPWSYDPYGAEIVNDAIYGRGTADMKGALSAMIYAAADVDRDQLKGRVAVSATVLEEVLEGVTLKLVVEELQPDFVVIGEATELNLNRGGRGRAEVHLETIGKPAHSSSPHLGKNAATDMVKVIQSMGDIELPYNPLIGRAIMVLTDIISEPYPGHSVIPSRCRVTYDRRLLPGETVEEVTNAIRQATDNSDVNLNIKLAQGEHEAFTGKILRSEKFFPAWIFPEDHPFVMKAFNGLQSSGLEPKIGAYLFCTNGAYCAGVAGIPTVGFGPGAEGDAHTVDEHIQIKELEEAARGYKGIVENTLR